MIIPSFQIVEDGCYHTDFCINCQVILNNKVNCVGRYSFSLSDEYSLTISIDTNIGETTCWDIEHVKLLKGVKRPNSYS